MRRVASAMSGAATAIVNTTSRDGIWRCIAWPCPIGTSVVESGHRVQRLRAVAEQVSAAGYCYPSLRHLEPLACHSLCVSHSQPSNSIPSPTACGRAVPSVPKQHRARPTVAGANADRESSRGQRCDDVDCDQHQRARARKRAEFAPHADHRERAPALVESNPEMCNPVNSSRSLWRTFSKMNCAPWMKPARSNCPRVNCAATL